jgi:transcriptional regulator with XRE-family HTH domain
MTGSQFKAILKQCGLTQKEAARLLGVNEDTITTRCQDVAVPALYRYALLGLVAERFRNQINSLSETIGLVIDPPEIESRKQ